jgi:hypothetical protein
MNYTTKVKIERPTMTTTAGERMLDPLTTVASSEPARIESLGGRLQETILGRFPNATHIIHRWRRSVAPKPNDVITDLTTNDVFVVEDVRKVFGGRRLRHYELILSMR